MKLYFSGCSHTYGDDLSDPTSQSWPAIISSRLGHKFLNDSTSGGTNDRIMYRTIKNIDQFDKFYIAWTYTTRFTRYRADNNYEINFNPQLTHAMYGKSLEFLQYGKLHYSIWHNELYSFKLWLQNIILLQTLFKSKNKSYVMINADNNLINQWTSDWPLFNDSVHSFLCVDLMNDNQLRAENLEIQNLLKQIDFSHYIGWNSWWLTQLLETYPVGPTGHLLEEGHLATAQYILKHDTN
jgi:hypothetical protein